MGVDSPPVCFLDRHRRHVDVIRGARGTHMHRIEVPGDRLSTSEAGPAPLLKALSIMKEEARRLGTSTERQMDATVS